MRKESQGLDIGFQNSLVLGEGESEDGWEGIFIWWDRGGWLVVCI